MAVAPGSVSIVSTCEQVPMDVGLLRCALAADGWPLGLPLAVLQPQDRPTGDVKEEDCAVTHWEAGASDTARGNSWAMAPTPGDVASREISAGSQAGLALFPVGALCPRHIQGRGW